MTPTATEDTVMPVDRYSGDVTMDEERWFGAKTIYQWGSFAGQKHPLDTLYEERINIIRARNLDDALARGEALALTYARELGDAKYLRFIDVYEISDDIGEGAEVYSITRSSLLAPADFITQYYDDGTQHSRGAGDPPSNPSQS